MNMASVCVARFGQVGRRTAVKLMVVGAVGLMSLAGTNPALAASDDQASFWTQFTPSVDTRLIFVSSSAGNDSNSGLTPATPVKTIARGYQLLRDGSPDWLLLKRGDTWVEALPNWMKSGRSESEKMVMGAYGDGDSRPQIRPPDGVVGMNAIGNSKTDHVAFVGFHLEPKERLGDSSPVGFRWLRRGEDILFEDLFVGGWSANFILQAAGDGVVLKDFRINGCVIVDAWSTTSHSQGLFIYGTDGMVIENSVIASNGFNPDRGADPTVFNHNIYAQTGSVNLTVRNNIIADASSHGIQMRCGGVVDGNVFISNPISILIGGGYTPTSAVTCDVKGNLIMYGRDLSPGQPRAMGIDLQNIGSGEVANNILFSTGESVSQFAVRIKDQNPDYFGISNLSIRSNWVVKWNSPVGIYSPGSQTLYERISISDNHVIRDFADSTSPIFLAFAAGDDRFEFNGNEVLFTGDYPSPFQIGANRVSSSAWQSQIDPSMDFRHLDSAMPQLGLEAYLQDFGIQGNTDTFMLRARKLTRRHGDAVVNASSVTAWHQDRLE